jgi:hydroxyacylglutathione hydrolase
MVLLRFGFTPGHTGGSICIKAGNRIFTGDTLFKEAIGKPSIQDTGYRIIIESIMIQLMNLEDKVEVYPGHGDVTTIGFEKQNNPFSK